MLMQCLHLFCMTVVCCLRGYFTALILFSTRIYGSTVLECWDWGVQYVLLASAAGDIED